MSSENEVGNTPAQADESADHDESRAAKRRSVLWPATLHIEEFKFDCQIRNFSMRGLKLKFNLPFKEGTAVRVEIPMRHITLNAVIAWQNDKAMGIEFLEDKELLQGVFGERASGIAKGEVVLQRNYRNKLHES